MHPRYGGFAVPIDGDENGVLLRAEIPVRQAVQPASEFWYFGPVPAERDDEAGRTCVEFRRLERAVRHPIDHQADSAPLPLSGLITGVGGHGLKQVEQNGIAWN